MLKVSNIETGYGASQVLFGMSLTVGAGEVVTLMGRNGMGKSTTVRSIMGIQPLTAGEIVMEGTPLQGLASYKVAKAGLGLVPEGRQVFPNLTVHENLIATAANRSRRPDPWTAEKVYALFPALAQRRDGMGGILSGGEQQMLAIGRALTTNPKLIILDEATEGLAPLVMAEIWRVLRQLKEAGQSILIIDKNVETLTRIADRHYIMEKGRVVWSGTSRELRADTGLQHRTLGV